MTWKQFDVCLGLHLIIPTFVILISKFLPSILQNRLRVYIKSESLLGSGHYFWPTAQQNYTRFIFGSTSSFIIA